MPTPKIVEKCDQTFCVLSDQIEIPLTSEDTGGSHSVVIATTPPDCGTPPHVHEGESETFYILEGEYEFWIDGKTVCVGPGATVHGPAGVPHCYKVVSSTPGKAIIFIQPGGFEQFFMEVDPLCRNGEPDLEAIVNLLKKYGCQILPPA